MKLIENEEYSEIDLIEDEEDQINLKEITLLEE